MNTQDRQRLEDWLKWYNYHHSNMRNAGLETKVIFLDKCVRGLLELIANLSVEVERVDLNRNVPHIILPTGVRLNDPLREEYA